MDKLIELIIEKSKGYGTPDRPITMSIFQNILEDVKKDLQQNPIKIV